MAEARRNVLIVTTNHDRYQQASHPTGNWLGEVTHFYDVLHTAGYQIDLTSPLGGAIPFDPKSLQLQDQVNAKWWRNAAFADQVKQTIPADQIDWQRYDAIYYAGGHGVMWDFPDNAALQAIARQLYEAGRVVSAVCHGVGGLLNIKLSSGALLINQKRLTGFSNFEERLAGLTKEVPFLLESALRERGADYHKAWLPFSPYVVTSDRLVTGQNPKSAHLVGQRVLALLTGDAHQTSV
jgi:putative intracellular protease/amidase